MSHWGHRFKDQAELRRALGDHKTTMTVLRLGRNDRCWCGSGKKFKKCHLDRDRQVRSNPFDNAYRRMREFKRPVCSHPMAGHESCDGGIVRAHTVRRAADLTSIAAHGHVMQFQADLKTLNRTKGRPEARPIGINDASTFLGFCSRHDGDTFRSLEAEPFIGSSEQCFLLLYRAWCREAYAKEAAGRGGEILREADKGRPLAEQLTIQRHVQTHLFGVEMGIRDVRYYKAIADAALLRSDFGIIHSVVYEFAEPLPVVCSGGFYPYFDIEGARLQEFHPSITPEVMTITLLNQGDVGFGVLSWLAGAVAPNAFADAISGDSSISNAMCSVGLIALENTFVSPTWWSGLTDQQRSDITRRFAENLDPFIDIRPGDLIPFRPRLFDIRLNGKRAV